jgi:hypothetical protein
MTHRMMILILVVCLLGGCSGGDATTDGDRSGASTPAPSEEVLDSGPETSGVVPEQATPDTIDTAGDPGVDVGARHEEEPEEDEAAGEPEPDNEPPAVVPANSGLRVLRAYVCKGIEQGEPTEAGKSFIPEDGVLRLCCFSEIAGAAGPDMVYHVWRWGDREMARVELEVKSSRWRTWSTKRILDEWRGEWHVDITDSSGGVLTRLEFSVE